MSTAYAGSVKYAPHGGTTEIGLDNSRWEMTRYNRCLQPSIMMLRTAAPPAAG